jgi:DNA-binding LytR/AlgR family response regulator
MDVEGNAQGLKLTLEDLDNRKVPVSRKYISEFQQ